jgi:hypothetical protein
MPRQLVRDGCSPAPAPRREASAAGRDDVTRGASQSRESTQAKVRPLLGGLAGRRSPKKGATENLELRRRARNAYETEAEFGARAPVSGRDALRAMATLSGQSS